MLRYFIQVATLPCQLWKLGVLKTNTLKITDHLMQMVVKLAVYLIEHHAVKEYWEVH